jgi:hypothetical protein
MKSLFLAIVDIRTQYYKIEVFYNAQYDVYYRLKKDSYVIEDLYGRIRRLRLILYYQIF